VDVVRLPPSSVVEVALFLGLNRREWRAYGKLIGTVVLALCYLLGSNALEVPADLFIYGRF
jgi:hypothetical protein